MPASSMQSANEPPDGPHTLRALYDFDSIVSVAGGDQQIVRQLIQGLIQSNRNDLAELKVLLERGDLSGLVEIAHRFKGPAKIINSPLLLRCCNALEGAARATQLATARQRGLELRELVLQMEAALMEQMVSLPDH